MGGPQSDDSFEDSRGWCCAAYNEVAIDYNAGFTGAVARLVDYYKDQKLFSDCSLDLGWDHANATLVSLSVQCSRLYRSCGVYIDATPRRRTRSFIDTSIEYKTQNRCPLPASHAGLFFWSKEFCKGSVADAGE